MKNRLAYIDSIRAYAIFLVTGFHLWRFFGRPNENILCYNLFSIFEKGWGGVELFFLISGYSMALITYKDSNSYQTINWIVYLQKRLYRIIPAYYIAIFIWTILICNGVSPKPIGLMDQISHLLFIHTFNPNTYYSISGVFWSMGIEMQFYLLLPFLLKYIVKYFWILLPISLVPIMHHSFIEKSFLLDKTVFAYFVYFILGYLTYIYRDLFYSIFYDNKYKNIILLIFVAVFLHITFFYTYLINGSVHILLWTVSFIPIFIYMYKNDFINNSKNKFLQLFIFTGRASYSIYLYNYIFYIHKKPISYSLESLIFYFFLIYLIGIFMYYCVEMPFQKLRKKVINEYN